MPRLIWLVGPPGSGKSHLLRSFKDDDSSLWEARLDGALPYLYAANVVILGRYVQHHPATGSPSDRPSLDGADRIVPGAGTAALWKKFPVWATDGVQLIVGDTVRPQVLCHSTLQAAEAAGFEIKLLELPTPDIEEAKRRWRQRELPGKLKSEVELKLQAAYDRWPAKRDALAERWGVEAVNCQQALGMLRSARAASHTAMRVRPALQPYRGRASPPRARAQ